MPESTSTHYTQRVLPLVIGAIVGCFVIGGLCLLGWFYIYANSFAAPRGFLSNEADWPKPLAELFDGQDIEIYGLPQLLDQRVIAQVEARPELVEQLIQTHSLKTTDASHPLAQTLKNVTPSKWGPWQDSADDRWYTTKDFGSVHLEGQDLFLIVINSKSGRSVIYYNWIF